MRPDSKRVTLWRRRQQEVSMRLVKASKTSDLDVNGALQRSALRAGGGAGIATASCLPRRKPLARDGTCSALTASAWPASSSCVRNAGAREPSQAEDNICAPSLRQPATQSTSPLQSLFAPSKRACHSERSEESRPDRSSANLPTQSEIPRFARNDTSLLLGLPRAGAYVSHGTKREVI